jgi:DNA-binding CsgD family transcriptional regulator/GAF domain-containing protein
MSQPRPTTAAAGNESRWERQLIARVERLLTGARTLLDADLQLPVADHQPLGVAAGALSGVVSTAVAQLEQLGKRGHEKARALTSMSLRALELQHDLNHQIATHRAQRYEEMQRGLGRLRRFGTSAQLLDRVCEEVVHSCGFSRAMLTRVEGGQWLPWMSFFTDDREFEREFVEWMNKQKFPASALGRDLTQLRPVIVHDALGEAGTFRAPISFSKTPCYVAAPIHPAGRMVGVLYADRYPTGRPVDEEDRDVLWAFTEDLGRIYERIALIERMRTQRSQVREAYEFAENFMASLASAEIQLTRGPEDHTAAAANGQNLETPKAPPIVEELLTAREAEVLEMMVRGASNAMIAERLIIKEGTVKSHVKHILRKLDAVNRAEAISRYMGRARGDAGFE